MKKLLILTAGLATLFVSGCATTPQQACAPAPRFVYILSQSNIVLGTYHSEQSARYGSVFLRGPFRITPMLIEVPAINNAGYITAP